MNPYEILALPYEADRKEVKKAFRQKALLYHPDRGGDEAKFRDVVSAYKMISAGWNPSISESYQHERVSSKWEFPDTELFVSEVKFWKWVKNMERYESKRFDAFLYLPHAVFTLAVLALYIFRPFG
jgi:curved DNA-binding protein CbpA